MKGKVKITGCICIFLAAAGAGLYGAMELERRKKQIAELKRGMLSLEREIEFQLSTLSEALLHTGERVEKPWKGLFSYMGERLEDREGTKFALRENIPELFLEGRKKYEKTHPWKKEWDILTSLFQNLGQLDKEMQMAQIRMAKEELDQIEKEAKEEQRKKGKLYQWLGLCMGTLGVILFL